MVPSPALDTRALSREDPSIPPFLRMAFWQFGACFSGSPSLGELEQTRSSAWRSEGLVAIQVVCEAPEGDPAFLCLAPEWGASARLVCVFSEFTLCVLVAFKGHRKKQTNKQTSSGDG